ncbi:MAG: DegT/DnrJ/EryC1/StrS family aminotransferase [Candidatus Margulisiibacteriota bacterium]
MTTSTITHVPLLDLQAQYEPISDQILAVMRQVFEEKQFILGPQVAELERQTAAYCGSAHGIGVTSGTDALLMALMAIDLQPGDEVITSPFTFFATAGSISRLGGVPVFVDIDDTFNIDPNKIEAKITAKTKAIMPVHVFGQMADMTPILAIAKKHNLVVIEDAAQAIGSTYIHEGKEYKAGSLGDMGCFSFFPSKNLGCAGDGGLITTNNPQLAEKLVILRNHGAQPRYYHKLIGGNFRLDTLQAAILLVKLPLLEDQHERRIQNANYYTQHLKGIQTPVVHTKGRMIFNQYTLQTPRRNELIDHLNKHKIGNAIYYPVPLHLQECFAHLGYKAGDMPNSEKAANQVLSIPIYAELTRGQLDYIVDTINRFG